MSLLILGGTLDGRTLAKQLHEQGLSVIYSVAGLVRQPELDCKVISGGFSQYGGLEQYIAEQGISGIVDVTHPFAKTMSHTAFVSAKACDVPYWRFHRRPWQQQVGDNWQTFNDWPELLAQLKHKQRVFFSAGQIPLMHLPRIEQMAASGQQQLLRTAVKPKHDLPSNMQWLKAIGPFTLEQETQLLNEYNIDVIVSKNSGGDSTVAKLTAARQLGIEVLMLQRPPLPDDCPVFNELIECQQALLNFYQCSKN